MEFISKEKIVELSNPGVVSRQLLNPENSSSERVTITEVHLEIGACQPRHAHDASEQIWYATKGTGKLLFLSTCVAQVANISLSTSPIIKYGDLRAACSYFYTKSRK